MREATAREMDRFTVIVSVEDNNDDLHTFGIWTRIARSHQLNTVVAANRYEAVAMYLDSTNGYD